MSGSPFDTPQTSRTVAQPMGPGESTRPSTEKPTLEPALTPPEPPNPGTPARLVITRGPDAGAEFAVAGPVTTIGRHRDCDVVLDQVTVSRYHAELRRDGDRYTIIDAGSLNGIYVNRHPTDRAELTHGDQLWIGTVHFTFHAAG